MTDLDTFAAAALKGLLANPNCDHLEDTDLALRAYEIASAMTEQRDHWNGIVAPTLTEAERDAIEAAIVGRLELADFATLRNLLERLSEQNPSPSQ
jgi:hypothetical protein